jgi:hypothetical protein
LCEKDHLLGEANELSTARGGVLQPEGRLLEQEILGDVDQVLEAELLQQEALGDVA